MYTVTFYSYKGGVGRTLALMNTAARLSRRGKSVFVIDFDLEAPGVDVFSASNAESTRGLVEYISHYSETGTVLPLKDFVSELPSSGHGKVHLLPAGRKDSEYQKLLARLNWKEFYATNNGFLFVENLKAAIRAEFAPDYILVDSRTGLTDISGICTLQLPDLVVLMFGLNNQNLEGIAKIFRSIKKNRMNRQIETMLVASPVPDIPEFVSVRQERLQKAKQLLDSEPELILPFNAFVAFQETTSPNEIGQHLNTKYEELCDAIIKRNKFDITTMLKEAQELVQLGYVDIAEKKYAEIIEGYPAQPLSWAHYGRFLRLAKRYSDALFAYERSESLGGHVAGDIAVTSLMLEKFDTAKTYLSLFLERSRNSNRIRLIANMFSSKGLVDEAIAAYEKARRLGMNSEARQEVLLELGSLYIRNEAPEKAIEVLSELLELAPSQLPANYNFATALARAGRESQARQHFQKVIDMFEQQSNILAPTVQANRSQAMGIAYEFMGNRLRAIELLQAAMQVAETLKESPIFSAVKYTNISADEFRLETLALLNRYELSAAQQGMKSV
jgi:tetratricopeptide (TPR) repeat protein